MWRPRKVAGCVESCVSRVIGWSNAGNIELKTHKIGKDPASNPCCEIVSCEMSESVVQMVVGTAPASGIKLNLQELRIQKVASLKDCIPSKKKRRSEYLPEANQGPSGGPGVKRSLGCLL